MNTEQKLRKQIADAEKVLAMYLATATQPARGVKKFDLADCDAKARAYFVRYRV